MKIPAWNVYFGVREDLSFMVYDRQTGLVAVPLDKMNAQWQSGANKM